MLWNSTMPCFSPGGDSIAWSASNWVWSTWQKDEPGKPPYDPSYWKRDDRDQGMFHHIWIRGMNRPEDDNHNMWFPPTYWAWNDELGHIVVMTKDGGYQHKMHYNPSWDYQPGKQP